MGGDNPLVSVIMNCYNGEDFLAEAVESVLKQTYENWELIFWDNQSTDASADVIMSYDDVRIRYFRSKNHTNLYEARGLAYRRARGDFIAFLDTDDMWCPSKLEMQIKLFKDKEIGFVYSNYYKMDIRSKKIKVALGGNVPSGYILGDLLKEYFVGILTLVIRRDALESLEIQFDPRFHIIGDFDLVIRLASMWKAGVITKPLATYRIHDNNESSKKRALTIEESEIWYQENRKNGVIGRSKKFNDIRKRISYMKGINYILKKEKMKALTCLRNISIKNSMKLLIAIIIPLNLIKIITGLR